MRYLKQCPFCGQIPDLETGDAVYPITRPDQFDRALWRAGCVESAGGCGAEVTGWSEKEAIMRWETRVR